MNEPIKKLRGFAAMNPIKRLELCRKGGSNVPKEKRSFSQNHQLASEAGRMGGKNVSASKRSFSINRELAKEAGRAGGRKTQMKWKFLQDKDN